MHRILDWVRGGVGECYIITRGGLQNCHMTLYEGGGVSKNQKSTFFALYKLVVQHVTIDFIETLILDKLV